MSQNIVNKMVIKKLYQDTQEICNALSIVNFF